jgi:hypothetical protein
VAATGSTIIFRDKYACILYLVVHVNSETKKFMSIKIHKREVFQLVYRLTDSRHGVGYAVNRHETCPENVNNSEGY